MKLLTSKRPNLTISLISLSCLELVLVQLYQ